MSDSPSDVEVNGHKSNDDEQLSRGDAGGLFGSGSEDEGSGDDERSNKRRKLDDSELDSGDDEDRIDRVKDGVDGEEGAPERTAVITDISIGRHPGPSPSDGELYMLQFPSIIGIHPKVFTLAGFEPPATDHHSSEAPSSTFSAFTTSNNTIRWRKSPSNPSAIQSNARINRWSDGSLTLQLATNSKEQFELSAKSLAQPQLNPPKPTPTSVRANRNNQPAYDSRLDSHTYLAAPHEHAGLMRNIQQITMSLAVQSSEQDDDALLRLQQGLAAAARGNKTTADGGLAVISINEDPELAKKQAEEAEKQRTKAQRRSQIQQDRDSNRANNMLKRSGLRQGGLGAGLTVGGLENDDVMGTTGRKAKPKARKSRRRNDEYSDDEDFGGRRRTKEDEYDEDDGFLVGSDEEPEVDGESEEEAEGSDLDAEGEEDEDVLPPPKKSKVKTPDTTEDAAGGGRQKRRRVIEEDEDEE